MSSQPTQRRGFIKFCAAAAAAVLKNGFRDVLGGDGDFLTPLHVGDAALVHRIRNRLFDVLLVTLEKTLPIHGALVLSVLPAVDDVAHAVPPLRGSSHHPGA